MDEIDWSGGSVSSGTWTGEPFNSRFIRSLTFDRPPRGLLSFYYNSASNGVWNQKNGAQRLGRGVYRTFTYLPMLLAVLYGRMWKVLDDDIKRIDMYYRLQKPNGTTGDRSLCLNYHTFWAPLSLFQALRYRHWSVAVQAWEIYWPQSLYRCSETTSSTGKCTLAPHLTGQIRTPGR